MSESRISSSFFLRHEFLIRRLHSLSGIVPLGAYMVIHLITNASLLNGAPTFQRAVFMIHSLGAALPIVEWGFIFLPLLFHAVVGVWIWRTGQSNLSHYRLQGNRRYTWQRWTGLVAFVYLMMHVFHLHGGLHFDPWLAIVKPLGGAEFSPYNAASTLIAAMNSWFWPPFYLAGVLACVYHLANGIWTAGITWGLWISPEAQARATKLCAGLGIVLAAISMGAWMAAVVPGDVAVDQAREVENRMYEAGVNAGTVNADEHKRFQLQH